MASLWINIFKDFPYIYDGSVDYEVKYLGRYLQAKNAQFVVAINPQNQLVRLATCLPLSEEESFVEKPFLDVDLNLEKIAYFCNVKRSPQHPLKPEGYRQLDDFWKSRGYCKVENLKSYFQWRDLGEASETTNLKLR